MDLESTILARYQGEALLQRLWWIATQQQQHHGSACSSPLESRTSAVQHNALKLAIDTARQQGNVRRYKEMFHLIQQLQTQTHDTATTHETTLDTTRMMDPHWMTEQATQNRQSRDVLLQRLAAAQAHLNKEAIRVAYLALAEHDERTGELKDALHSVLRAKDYCTSRPQTVAVSLQVLKLAIWLQSFKLVQEYTTKLTLTTTTSSSSCGGGATSSTTAAAAPASSSSSTTTAPGWEEAVQYKMWVATGLERLMQRDYKAAAQNFVKAVYATVQHQHDAAATTTTSSALDESRSADTEKGLSWSAVLAPDDVALYAAFLSLAVQDDRNELVALAEHPEALELVPQAREALHLFARRACYQEAWKLLEESVFGVLQMDLYMSMRFEQLRLKIREKALLQYWRSYQRVELCVLAAQMGPAMLPPECVEEVLAELIQRPEGGFPPDTRLDLHSHTLVRLPNEAARVNAAQRKLNTVSAQLLNDTYSMMVRLACVEHDLCVADPSARKRRGRYFGGAGDGLGGGHVLMDEDDDDELGSVQGESGDDDAQMMDAPLHEAEVDAMNPEDLY